jgi:hypothetical protein
VAFESGQKFSLAEYYILRSKAVQLVERYDLRAADSLQLAAALAWCEDAPSRTCLSDRRSKTEGSVPARRLRCQGNMISDISRGCLYTSAIIGAFLHALRDAY